MTSHARNFCPPSRQSGLTLIELMIGLLIGMLVSLAAVTSLGFTRLASSTVGDSARLHEDAASAFRVIGHHFRQAGAQRLVDAVGGRVSFNPAFVGFGNASQQHFIEGVNAANGPDTLSVRHDIEPLIFASDCLGSLPEDTDTHIENAFSVVGGSLRCAGSATDDPAPLVRGVEDLQVRYAVRNGATDAIQYADSPADWNMVEGVMVCLQLVGELGGQPTAPIVGCNGNPSAQDGRFRRAFWRVFQLRNVDA
jgi:type IV pilus assembly protein PilW